MLRTGFHFQWSVSFFVLSSRQTSPEEILRLIVSDSGLDDNTKKYRYYAANGRSASTKPCPTLSTWRNNTDWCTRQGIIMNTSAKCATNQTATGSMKATDCNGPSPTFRTTAQNKWHPSSAHAIRTQRNMPRHRRHPSSPFLKSSPHFPAPEFTFIGTQADDARSVSR